MSLGLCALAQAPKESGWVSLFNGKDLTGWKNNGQEKWVVENGTIYCESTANKYGYLTTEKTYKDFDLRLKFKGEAPGNAGGSDPSVGKHTGGLYESGGREWVAMPSAESEKALKPGQWNELEAKVQDHHIATYLNGVKISDFEDPKPTFTEGVIGLQIHTGGGVKMRWKDIYIREK
jgi:hypothetical protein